MGKCMVCKKYIDEYSSRTVSIDGDQVCKKGPCYDNLKKQNAKINNMTDKEFESWMMGGN